MVLNCCSVIHNVWSKAIVQVCTLERFALSDLSGCVELPRLASLVLKPKVEATSDTGGCSFSVVIGPSKTPVIRHLAPIILQLTSRAFTL